MNIDEIKHKLADIDAATLQDFILALYLHYPELNDKIEALLLYSNPAALANALGKRIQSLRRGRKFIDYRASFDFTRQLDALLADIENGLLANSPKHAFELVDKFLATAEPVLNRVDDSGGEVGEVYRQAVLLWLTAARGWQDASVDWPERVYQLYQQNDYGLLDPLLPNAHLLLSQDQLKQLAWRYESALRKVLKAPEQAGKANFTALANGVAMGAIAQALQDPTLYERSILIQYEQPEAAMRYLNQAWESRFEHDRLLLLDKVYTQMGHRQQLKHVRYQLFQAQQCHTSFMRYLEVLDEAEKANACDKAIAKAEQGGNLTQSVELLLNLGHPDRAQTLVLSRHQELVECFYNNVLRMAKAFEKEGSDLAATACYRALLLEILMAGRSKAYGHGARYFKKLEALAGRIKVFEPLLEHHAFVQQLQSGHGRKSSFWARL
jgi:hypothetical protein